MMMPGRKYQAGSDYRYGFNGKEKSDDVTAGNSTAEFWEYDSRTGRRWNLEPETKDYPGLSPYACFNDNPILYKDVNGKVPTGGPDPIQLFLDLFKDFRSANTTDISSISWGRGNALFPMNIKRIGRIFEDAVVRSMGVSKNTKIFKPGITSPRGVIPDAVADGRYTELGIPTDGNASPVKRRITFPNSVFQEVKFKSEVTLNDPNNPEQLPTMIRTLSNMKGGYDNGVWNPNLKASDYGAATLVIITPANGVINQDVLNYAKGANVNIVQRKVEVDKEENDRVRVAPGSDLLNNSSAGRPNTTPSPVQKVASPGASVKLNFDKL